METLVDPPSPLLGGGGDGGASPPRSPPSAALTAIEISSESVEDEEEAPSRLGAADVGPAADLGYRLNGEDSPPLARGDYRLNGEDSPPLAGGDYSSDERGPGERWCDWFLHRGWDDWMPWMDPGVLAEYGVQLTAEEVQRGVPWRHRPRPTGRNWVGPPLRIERIFNGRAARIAGGGWVLADGTAVQEPYEGWRPGLPGARPLGAPVPPPVRRPPRFPSLAAVAAAANRSSARPLARSRSPLLGSRLRASAEFCPEPGCGLASCFCTRGIARPPSWAQHIGVRPPPGSACRNHYFCLCGSCG